MSFLSNALGSWWLWGAFAAMLPTAILLLYFLKLKRQPLEVPSTYLWTRTIEDLHVNSIWQRLRQSLLLFLQLLLILLVMFALLRPGWSGRALIGDRFIFLIDASASMAAKDVKPNRLADALKKAGEMIDAMQSGDVGMVISFTNAARVEQTFTSSRTKLKAALADIEQTDRTSDLSEALRAASGLANPGRTGNAEEGDVAVAEALPATLYLFTDGGFDTVPDFSLGNLEPIYTPIGVLDAETSNNVAVVAFNTSRNPERVEQTQAFGRLENYGDADVEVDVELLLNGSVIDAQRTTLPAQGQAGVQFELTDFEQGGLRLVVQHDDDLAVDNSGYAAVNSTRRARILLITPRNDALTMALGTDEAQKLAAVTQLGPEVLPSAGAEAAALTEAQKNYQKAAASARYDLIIYDQCAPLEMPQSNTLFIGRSPPLESWQAGEVLSPPLVIDVDRSHPLMQMVSFDNVTIIEGFSLKPPRGSAVLIDADIGALFAIAPREGFEDAVMGFEIFSVDEKGEVLVNTDWLKRLSFPLFVKNVVEYLGGGRSAQRSTSVQPGAPVTIRTDAPVDKLYITSPSGAVFPPISRERENTFVFGATDVTGLYEVREKPGRGEEVLQRFAVNLFSPRESDLRLRQTIELGAQEVSGEAGWAPARKEMWKWLLLAGLGVLLFEWYVYNRRVYL